MINDVTRRGGAYLLIHTRARTHARIAAASGLLLFSSTTKLTANTDSEDVV